MNWWQRLLKRDRLERELDAELRFHVERQVEDNVREGMSEKEARRRARAQFGGLDQVKDDCRDARGTRWVEDAVQDLRFAARLLAKERWFTLSAVVALALGIGVNMSVFTIVNGMNLRALPVERPDQIMQLSSQELRGRGRGMGASYADFRDWQTATHTFSGLAAYTGATMNVGDDARPADRLGGWFISANGFSLLRVRPLLGRDFAVYDDRPGAAPVAILAHGVWNERYGGDPSIVGRVIRVNGTPTTVIGVMPQGFGFPELADMWQPMGLLPGLTSQPRDQRRLGVFGRLRDEARLQQARAELATIAAALGQQHPDTNADVGATVVSFTEHFVGRVTEGPPIILMAAGMFVLLIACANAANLLVARAVHRAREIALRAALGASRARIVRQLLVESVMLATLAGAVGLMLSVGALRFFRTETVDLNLPYWIHFDFDARVFAYLAVLSLGTALTFGLAPAWQLSKTNAHDILKEGGRGGAGSVRTRRWAGGLLVGELALTLGLLAGAGLLVRSGLALSDADAILDTRKFLTAELALPPAKFTTPDQIRAFYASLQERLDAIPTIAAATIASARPFVESATRQLVLEGEESAAENRRSVQMVAVGDRYFETLNLPLLRGRALGRGDALAGRQAVIINERFASLHFAGTDPLGRRIRLLEPNASAAARPWLTIVGVSPSVRQRPMGDAAAVAYVPLDLEGQAGPDIALIVRGADRTSIGSTLREEVQALDPDVAVYNVQPLERLSELSRWNHRIMGTMLTLFAVIATVLSAMGLYAVTAYGVSQRTAEIGIRMALGAQRSQVVWLFLRRTLLQLGLGVGIGIAGAIGVGQVIRGMLVRTSATDPVTFAGMVVLLVAVAAAACFIPARRATRLDPVAALRYE